MSKIFSKSVAELTKIKMMALVKTVQQAAPPGSTLVVEGDTAFDPAALPAPEAWEVRPVPPAVLYLQFK